MPTPIQKSDIVSGKLLDSVIVEFEQAKKANDALNASLRESARLMKEKLSNSKQSDTASIKSTNAALKEANQLFNQKVKLESEAIKNQTLLSKLRQQQAKELQQVNKATRSVNGAYKEQSARLNDLRRQFKDLAVTNRGNTKEARALHREITTLDNKLKKVDASVGQNQRNVGNYQKAIGGLRNAFLRLGLTVGAGQILRNVFTTVRDFEQSVANLQSILGATDEEMKKLTASSKELGATTIFTASQVSDLQTEYARLGFTTNEILDATDATLQLAAATGTDLAKSAQVAGSTVRQFGLDASETQRVVDVMAKSFSSSALNTERFSESMKFVGPVAAKAGLSLEETTAMLGKLADAGIHGSQAGTALRQVISEMDKTGKSTSEALEDLSKKSLTLADANDEVGKNAKTALLVLTDQTKAIAELDVQLQDASGSAKTMADIQRETLGGAVKLLTSAWEGFILRMNEAGGVGEKLRRVILFLADNLGDIFKIVGKVVKVLVLYKSVQIATLAIEKARAFNLKGLVKSMFSFGKATDGATKSTKGFSAASKAVGWTALIAGVISLVSAIRDIALGYDVAERKLKSFTRAKKFAEIAAQEEIDLMKKQILLEFKAIDLLEAKGKLTREEAIARKKDFILRKEFARDVSEIGQMETTIFESRLDQIDVLIEAEERRLALRDAEIRQLKANGDFKNRLLIADAKAEKDAIEVKIKAFKDFKAIINEDLFQLDLADATNIRDKGTEEVEGTKTKKTSKFKRKKGFSVEDDLKRKAEALKKEKQQLTKGLEELNDIRFEKGLERIELNRAHNELDVLMTNLTNEEKARLISQNNIEALEAEIAFRKKWGEETIDLEIRLAEERQALRDEEDAKALAKKQERMQDLNAIVQESANFFIEQSNKKIAQIDKEIAASEKQFDTLSELAKNGNIQAQQSLAAEQQNIVEANKKKAAEQKRQERIKFAAAAFGSYSANVEANEANPLLKTITDMTLLRQFITAMPSFEVGTEDTGSNGNGVDGRGGFHAILHPNERVMTKEQNAMLGGISNEEVAGTMMKIRSGQMVNIHEGATAINGTWGTNPMLSKLDELASIIKNKPEISVEAGEIIQGAMRITETKKQGNSIKRNKYIIK